MKAEYCRLSIVYSTFCRIVSMYPTVEFSSIIIIVKFSNNFLGNYFFPGAIAAFSSLNVLANGESIAT